MATSPKTTRPQLAAALATLGPNRRRTGIERPRTPAEKAASAAAFKRSMQGLNVPRKNIKPLDTSGPKGIMGALGKVMGAPGIKEGLKALRTPFSFVASHVADIGDEVLQGDVGGTIKALAGVPIGSATQIGALAAGAIGAHGVADQLNKAAYENDQYVSDFKKQTGAGAYGQRAIDHFDPNRTSWLNTSESGKWLKRGAGLFGDIALDPLTYLKPGTHILSGTSEQVAGRIAEKIPKMEADAMAQVLAKGGDEAAQLAAKKAAREFGEGVMHKVGTVGKHTMTEADFWRVFPDEKFAPGMAWGLPGTGRVGRRVQRTLGVSEPKQIQWTVLGKDKTNLITRAGGKPFRMIGKTKVFQSIADKTTGEYGPQIRGLLQDGDSYKYYKGLGLRKGVQNMRAAAASGLRMSTNDLEKFGMYSHLNIGTGDNIIGPTFGEVLEKEVLPHLPKGRVDADIIRQIETGNITSEAAQKVDDFFKHIEYTLEQRGVVMGSRQNGGYVTRWLTDDAFDRIHHDLNIPDSLADPKASFANRAITPEDLGLAEDASPDLVRSTLKAKYGDDIFHENLPDILESYVRAADATHGRQVLLETLSAWGISFRAEDIAEAVSTAANQGVGRAMRMLNAGRPQRALNPGPGGAAGAAAPDRFDDGMALIYDYLMGTLPETKNNVARLSALHASNGRLPGIQHTMDLFGVSRRDAKMLLDMARHDIGVASEVTGKTGMKALDAGPAPVSQGPSGYAPEAQMAPNGEPISMGPAVDRSPSGAIPTPRAKTVPLVKVPAGTSSKVEIALRNAVDIIDRTGRKFNVGDLVDQLGVRLSKAEARQVRDLLTANAVLVKKAAAEAEGVSKVVSMAVDGVLPSHGVIERELGVGRHIARKWKQLAEGQLATAEPAAAVEGARRWQPVGHTDFSDVTASIDSRAPITPEETAKIRQRVGEVNSRAVKLHNDGQLPAEVTAKLQKLGKDIDALHAQNAYPSRELLQREEALIAKFESIVNTHTPGFKPSVVQDGVGPAEWEYTNVTREQSQLEYDATMKVPEYAAAASQLERDYLDGLFDLSDAKEMWIDEVGTMHGAETFVERLKSLDPEYGGGDVSGGYDTTDYPAADQVRTSNRPNDTADVGSVPSTGRSVKGLSDDEFVAVTRDIAQRLGPAERAEFWDELNAVNESPVFHNADGSTKWEEYDDAIDEIVNRYDLRPRPNPGGGPAGPPSNYDHFGGGLNPQANQRPPSGGRMGDDHLGIPDSSDDLFGRPRRGGNPTVVQEGAAPYETAQDIANRTLTPEMARAVPGSKDPVVGDFSTVDPSLSPDRSVPSNPGHTEQDWAEARTATRGELSQYNKDAKGETRFNAEAWTQKIRKQKLKTRQEMIDHLVESGQATRKAAEEYADIEVGTKAQILEQARASARQHVANAQISRPIADTTMYDMVTQELDHVFAKHMDASTDGKMWVNPDTRQPIKVDSTENEILREIFGSTSKRKEHWTVTAERMAKNDPLRFEATVEYLRHADMNTLGVDAGRSVEDMVPGTASLDAMTDAAKKAEGSSAYNSLDNTITNSGQAVDQLQAPSEPLSMDGYYQGSRKKMGQINQLQRAQSELERTSGTYNDDWFAIQNEIDDITGGWRASPDTGQGMPGEKPEWPEYTVGAKPGVNAEFQTRVENAIYDIGNSKGKLNELADIDNNATGLEITKRINDLPETADLIVFDRGGRLDGGDLLSTIMRSTGHGSDVIDGAIDDLWNKVVARQAEKGLPSNIAEGLSPQSKLAEIIRHASGSEGYSSLDQSLDDVANTYYDALMEAEARRTMGGDAPTRESLSVSARDAFQRARAKTQGPFDQRFPALDPEKPPTPIPPVHEFPAVKPGERSPSAIAVTERRVLSHASETTLTNAEEKLALAKETGQPTAPHVSNYRKQLKLWKLAYDAVADKGGQLPVGADVTKRLAAFDEMYKGWKPGVRAQYDATRLDAEAAASAAERKIIAGKPAPTAQDEFNMAVPQDGSAPLRKTDKEKMTELVVHARENDIEHMMDNTDDIIKGCGE